MLGNSVYSACTRWALFQINFRPQQEIEAQLGSGQTNHSGALFSQNYSSINTCRIVSIVKYMLRLSSCPLNLLSLGVAQFWVHRFILFFLILMKQYCFVATVSHLINVGCWLFAVTAKENYWTHLSLEYHTPPVMSK